MSALTLRRIMATVIPPLVPNRPSVVPSVPFVPITH